LPPPGAPWEGPRPAADPPRERDFPLRPLRHLLVILVLGGVALGGVDPQVAGTAPREAPARKITRLRAKAARVQAAIDRMNARVEGLVKDYNEAH
jgi:hypothetical protein